MKKILFLMLMLPVTLWGGSSYVTVGSCGSNISVNTSSSCNTNTASNLVNCSTQFNASECNTCPTNNVYRQESINVIVSTTVTIPQQIIIINIINENKKVWNGRPMAMVELVRIAKSLGIEHRGMSYSQLQEICIGSN